MARRKNHQPVEEFKGVPAPAIAASEYFSGAHSRTKNKLQTFANMVLKEYPEIKIFRVEGEPFPNKTGKLVGIKLTCNIESPNELIDHANIYICSTSPLSNLSANILFRFFRNAYKRYLEKNQILTND